MPFTASELQQKRQILEQNIKARGELTAPDILQKSDLFFDLAGEDIGRRLLLTTGADGTNYCLRPDFTLPIAAAYVQKHPQFDEKSYGYLGPVFRQRENGPAEFDQAGLEFLAAQDEEAAFQQCLDFAIETAALYGEEKPRLHLGAVDLFEALLDQIDLPDVWRPRVRDRFGHDAAMGRLLDRLFAPEGLQDQPDLPKDFEAAKAKILAMMEEAGLSPYSGRSADEIAERYLEKRQLADAPVPAATVRTLREFLSITGRAHEQVFHITALAQKVGINLDPQLERLSARLTQLKSDAPQIEVEFDAGFSPRLDYYTGHVFELTSNLTGDVLASGGQYDRLLQRLGAQKQVTAIGCAVWVDRLEQGGTR
ncbi:ATP phosphoribosyltransferase regulatory subunit [Maritalea myrionectae]|mgnify:CR=1 FL=1|uniref:ATP phosphoribosyltransferase regulatory subunit n=1 Tax=Maritalea myrionectae TaxID=454601 RepID=UPI0004226D2B|nr:ATP phosphoribosyltransferase regulatory subunit [Maritalea myrionectae]